MDGTRCSRCDAPAGESLLCGLCWELLPVGARLEWSAAVGSGNMSRIVAAWDRIVSWAMAGSVEVRGNLFPLWARSIGDEGGVS